jgi:periplasmic protein TonB
MNGQPLTPPWTDLDGFERAFAVSGAASLYAVGTVVGAACLHLVAGLLVARALPHTVSEWTAKKEIHQVIELEPPPPPKEPPPAPPKEEAKPEAPLETKVAAKAPPAAAPPPPAQAAAVLTQDSKEPVDFGDAIVTGSATTYAGGQSAQNGTSKRAVVVSAPSSTGETGVVAAPAAPPSNSVDQTRKARLAGGASWNCPFPGEADGAQIDQAVVTLRIVITASGDVRSVAVESDPGNGFGREARACAMRKKFDAALDRDGKPVEGTSRINVRFAR